MARFLLRDSSLSVTIVKVHRFPGAFEVRRGKRACDERQRATLRQAHNEWVAAQEVC